MFIVAIKQKTWFLLNNNTSAVFRPHLSHNRCMNLSFQGQLVVYSSSHRQQTLLSPKSAGLVRNADLTASLKSYKGLILSSQMEPFHPPFFFFLYIYICSFADLKNGFSGHGV